MWKKTFFNIDNLAKIIWMNLSIVIFLSVMGTIITIQEFGFGALEVLLTFWMLTLTTIFYQQYSKPNLLKRLELENSNKNLLQINLFGVVFAYGIMFSVFYLFWAYFYSIYIETNANIAGTTLSPIEWQSFCFDRYFFFTIAEILVLIIFGYFLNHFIKNVNYIYSIILFYVIYLVVFGNMILVYLTVSKVDGNNYVVWSSENYKNRIIFNSFIAPWSSIGIWGKTVFKNTNVQFELYDFSYINKNVDYGNYFISLSWTPYLYLVSLLSITKASSFRSIQT